MERKPRRELFLSAPRKHKRVGRLRRPQILRVDRPIVVHNLGKAQLDLRSRRPRHPHPLHACQVLPKVVHPYAGLRLGHLHRLHFLLHANRSIRLRHNAHLRRLNRLHALPGAILWPLQVPHLRLAVVQLRALYIRAPRLPARIRLHPLHTAVLVLNAQLRPQRRSRHTIIVRQLEPLQRRRVPARRKQRAQHVPALLQHLRHVVRLVHHALAIVRPPRRKHVAAHALAVQKHLIHAQRRRIQPRALHRRFHIECMPQRLHTIRQPRISHLRHVLLARIAAAALAPHLGLLPAGIVEPRLLPALCRMHRALPARVASKCLRRSVRVLHHQRLHHRRRIVGRHPVGIHYVMQYLHRNRVRAFLHFSRHIRAHKFLPRHLLIRRQRILSHRRLAIHPRRHRVLPGRIQRRALHCFTQRHRRAIRKPLLVALGLRQRIRIRAHHPLCLGVPHRGLFRRLVSNPGRRPRIALTGLHHCSLPPARPHRLVRLPIRSPHPHPPLIARTRLQRLAVILHVLRLVTRHLARVPHIRLARLQQTRIARHPYLVRCLPRARRRVQQPPAKPRCSIVNPQRSGHVVHFQMHRPRHHARLRQWPLRRNHPRRHRQKRHTRPHARSFRSHRQSLLINCTIVSAHTPACKARTRSACSASFPQ